jgi:putative oxidoreductase
MPSGSMTGQKLPAPRRREHPGDAPSTIAVAVDIRESLAPSGVFPTRPPPAASPRPTPGGSLMHQLCSTLNRGRPAAPLVLRVVIGGLFIWHGIDKFDAGISMVEEMFTMWGVPAPGLTAPLTAIIEIVAGILLVLGLGTRVAAMALSVVMVGALIYVKQDLGIISSEPMPGAELDLALLAGLVAIIVMGPGRLAVDPMIGLEPAESLSEREPALV